MEGSEVVRLVGRRLRLERRGIDWTPIPCSQDCTVPNAPQIKRQHNIEISIVFRAASVILNARRTGTNLAAFANYQASRSWPFRPVWQNTRTPSAINVQGPTVQIVTNIIPLTPEKMVLALLQRSQEEQELLTKSRSHWNEAGAQ
jgi:hypothetical protein